jgi:hypothetical protein
MENLFYHFNHTITDKKIVHQMGNYLFSGIKIQKYLNINNKSFTLFILFIQILSSHLSSHLFSHLFLIYKHYKI